MPLRAIYAGVPLVLVVIGTGVVSACAGAPVVDCLSPSAARVGFQHCSRECQSAQCVCGPCPCDRRFSEQVSQSHSHTTGRSTLQPCVMSSSVILMNVALEWGQPVIYPTAPLHSCVPSGSMCVRPSSSLSSASESGRSVNSPNVQSVATSVMGVGGWSARQPVRMCHRSTQYVCGRHPMMIVAVEIRTVRRRLVSQPALQYVVVISVVCVFQLTAFAALVPVVVAVRSASP